MLNPEVVTRRQYIRVHTQDPSVSRTLVLVYETESGANLKPVAVNDSPEEFGQRIDILPLLGWLKYPNDTPNLPLAMRFTGRVTIVDLPRRVGVSLDGLFIIKSKNQFDVLF